MLPYILLIITVVGLTLFSVDKSLKYATVYVTIYVLAIVTGFFAGLRYEVGFDYNEYVEHYSSTKDIFHFERNFLSMELGYELIVSTFKLILSRHFTFFLILGLVTMIIFGKASLRLSPYPGLTFLMLFSYLYFPMVMGQMRQPLAIGLVYLFWYIFKANKKVLFAFVVFLAGFFFHKSIWFFIPFIFIIPYKIPVKLMVPIAISSLFMGEVLKSLIYNGLSFVPTDNSAGMALEFYLNTGRESTNFTLGMLEKSVTLLIILHFYSRKKFSIKYPKGYLLVNTYFWGFIVYFSLIQISDVFAARGTHLFTFSMFLLLPMFYSMCKPKAAKYGTLLFISVWSLYLISRVFFEPIYFPYKTILLN